MAVAPLPFDLALPPEYSIATYPAGASYGPRTLRNWEFVWMIEGDAEYTHAGRVFAAPAGSVVLCRPPATDAFIWDRQKRTRHAYFHFDLRGEPPAEWPAPAHWPVVRSGEEGDLLRPLFRHLLAWSGRGDPLHTKLVALNLLAAFVTGQIVSGEVGRERLPQAVEQALAFITRRLDEEPAAPLALDDLAGAACVTPGYLCRVFKSATGRSPMETVRLARLDRAAALLARTNFSIGEIASLCGFDSPFHFSRRFRQAFGRSPSEMRRALDAGAHVPASRLLRD